MSIKTHRTILAASETDNGVLSPRNSVSPSESFYFPFNEGTGNALDLSTTGLELALSTLTRTDQVADNGPLVNQTGTPAVGTIPVPATANFIFQYSWIPKVVSAGAATAHAFSWGGAGNDLMSIGINATVFSLTENGESEQTLAVFTYTQDVATHLMLIVDHDTDVMTGIQDGVVAGTLDISHASLQTFTPNNEINIIGDDAIQQMSGRTFVTLPSVADLITEYYTGVHTRAQSGIKYLPPKYLLEV